jgi:hypothetical protein
MEQKETRKKIWLIPTEDDSQVTKVMELMRKYSDGLNSSQDLLKSSVDAFMDTTGDPVFSITANGHLIASVRLGMNYSHSQFCIILKLNHFKKVEQTYFSIEQLEKAMDDAIAGHEMGSYVAHLMAVEARTLY